MKDDGPAQREREGIPLMLTILFRPIQFRISASEQHYKSRNICFIIEEICSIEEQFK
jgi:hypothetical protein